MSPHPPSPDAPVTLKWVARIRPCAAAGRDGGPVERQAVREGIQEVGQWGVVGAAEVVAEVVVVEVVVAVDARSSARGERKVWPG